MAAAIADPLLLDFQRYGKNSDSLCQMNDFDKGPSAKKWEAISLWFKSSNSLIHSECYHTCRRQQRRWLPAYRSGQFANGTSAIPLTPGRKAKRPPARGSSSLCWAVSESYAV